MELTDKMIEGIKQNDLFFLATCSNEQIPNVVPIRYIKWLGGNKVLMADNFMKKTKQNILNNPNVSFVVKEIREYPFQFKGEATIYTEGYYFDEAVKMVENHKPKSALVMEIKEVYSVNSKDRPGELILK